MCDSNNYLDYYLGNYLESEVWSLTDADRELRLTGQLTDKVGKRAPWADGV